MRTDPRRRQKETADFSRALRGIRRELKWSQADLARELLVSRRTLSHWELGHWLPPADRRVHIILRLRRAPPEWVLLAADGLGVSVDPLVKPLLQTFEDAIEDDDDSESAAPVASVVAEAPVPAAPAPDPPPPPPTVDALRAVMDPVVKDAADQLDLSANELRAAIGRVLAAGVAIGGTVEGLVGAVEVRARGREKEKRVATVE